MLYCRVSAKVARDTKLRDENESTRKEKVKQIVQEKIALMLLVSMSEFHTLTTRECPRGVRVKAMDCGIVVSEFVLQSRYYVHIRSNTLGKGMNPLILPAMG